jgi:hypothetical protein
MNLDEWLEKLKWYEPRDDPKWGSGGEVRIASFEVIYATPFVIYVVI